MATAHAPTYVARLNTFLDRYAQVAEDKGELEKADRVRREKIEDVDDLFERLRRRLK